MRANFASSKPKIVATSCRNCFFLRVDDAVPPLRCGTAHRAIPPGRPGGRQTFWRPAWHRARNLGRPCVRRRIPARHFSALLPGRAESGERLRLHRASPDHRLLPSSHSAQSRRWWKAVWRVLSLAFSSEPRSLSTACPAAAPTRAPSGPPTAKSRRTANNFFR